MSQGWEKVFQRINWRNRPNTATPLNATNMNVGDAAMDTMDDRIIQLDTLKADMQVVNGMVADISVNDADGVITVIYKNGSTKTYDTNLEKIAVNFEYDYENQRLVLTLSDSTIQYVDMSALITQYEFADSTTIAFSVDSTGKVSASVKDGSITDEMLETQYLAQIKTESAKAQSASEQAQSSETASDYNAKLSQSYAIGNSQIRDNEDTDNAKYYCTQAKAISESLAKGYVTGVKGNKEKIYRRGDVNLTCDNIGALAIDGDSQDNTVTFTSNDSLTGDSTAPELLTSGETHASIFSKVSTLFKNVRWLLPKIGTTDISSIGDGSITSALIMLNANKQDASTAITTSNIDAQSVNYANSSGSATKDANGNTISSTYLKLSSIARTDVTNLYSTTYYTSMGIQYYIQYGKLVFVHLCFKVNLAVAAGSHICELTKLTSNLMEASNIATISPNTLNVYTYAAKGGTKWINTNMAIPKDTIINIDVVLALV